MADATQVRAHLLDWADRVFLAATHTVTEVTRNAAPVGTSPTAGETRDSVVSVPESSPPAFAARIVCPTPQGQYVEEGTPDFTMPPGKVMVFEIDGEIIFARSRKGIKAKPWFHPTIEASYLPALYEAAGQYN